MSVTRVVSRGLPSRSGSWVGKVVLWKREWLMSLSWMLALWYILIEFPRCECLFCAWIVKWISRHSLDICVPYFVCFLLISWMGTRISLGRSLWGSSPWYVPGGPENVILRSSGYNGMRSLQVIELLNCEWITRVYQNCFPHLITPSYAGALLDEGNSLVGLSDYVFGLSQNKKIGFQGSVDLFRN